jgi:hypothetical protein
MAFWDRPFIKDTLGRCLVYEFQVCYSVYKNMRSNEQLRDK